jgi:hypothetical protein
MKILLSTAYFPPVQYFSKLSAGKGQVILERHEHYDKQSYRNRCTILTSNGLLDLIVPVAKNIPPKVPITEVKIACDKPWQKLHLKAIESAYRRSPFYEYYIDELMPFFTERYLYLYDLNLQIITTLCRLAQVPFRPVESSEYQREDLPGVADFRSGIHPKRSRQKTDPSFTPFAYTQVFSEKFDFQPNLSALDLLFNMGPDMTGVLKAGYVHA